MEVTINTVSEVLQEAEIEVSHAELVPHFEEAYKKYQPKVELRGFRKGKVPMEMIKKLYGEAIEHESLDTVASEFYRKAMTERNIQPLGQPSMVDMDFKRGEHFRFKIKYEVKPAIVLKKYKGISVEKPVHTVTDEELNGEVEHLRHANSTTEDAAAVTGAEFIVTADVQELDDAGTPLIGKKTAGAKFTLSDETLVKEIREALASAEVGGTYRAKFESQHEDHSHPVHIALTVTKIEKVNLPAFDDELVKKITDGKVTSKDEFWKNLRTDIQKYWDEQSEKKVSDALAAETVKAHDFPVPDSLVNNFIDAFVEDLKSRSRDRKLPKNFDEKKFREDSKEYATWQAKWMLLKERIVEVENLTVADEEIEQLAQKEAVHIGIDAARLLEYYKSSSSAADRLLTDKVVALLKSQAKIKEKVVDEKSKQ